MGSGSAFAQGTNPFFAVLAPGNECTNASPPVCRQGDANGFGSAMILFPNATTICYAIIVHGLATIGTNHAHIHAGAASFNGGVVVNMSPPAPLTGNPNGWGNCRAVAQATADAIKANPNGFYVNVHTNEKPSGAVRGQLF
jgi:hypothetical protein